MSRQYEADVVLVGGGIMSATLGMFLHLLQPDWKITLFERLDTIAGESSAAWNNAGTGHAAFCELNYTPQAPDGTVNVTKALKIDEQFEISKQFWAYLLQQGILKDARVFLNSIPHMSFVRGVDDVSFLRKRHEALTKHYLFRDMLFSDNPEQLKEWIPLVMQGRGESEPVAGTYMHLGTDVNFGALTAALIGYLAKQENVSLHLQHEVKDLERDTYTRLWDVKVKDLQQDENFHVQARFVFIGAGGGALRLLEKSDIQEADGYGGFPVSGQWLRCKNETIAQKHHAKVYGKAAIGTPPMSVPHLDTRIIDGKTELLFGPYAGFSTKFLKEGSYLDLPSSIQWDNIVPMLQAGWDNIPLTRYLIQQVRMSFEEKFEELKKYYPDAKIEDWELAIAGQRVQVIKKDEEEGGVLEFGTEIVHAADGSLAALLGASPGASTAVAIMLDLLAKCFPKHITEENWSRLLKQFIPSYGKSLVTDEVLAKTVRTYTHQVLGLSMPN